MKIKITAAVLIILIALLAGSSFASASLYSSSEPKDSDLDGLTDQGEINLYKTDPFNPDTDGDGYIDSAEVLYGSNPLSAEALPQSTSEPVAEESEIPGFVENESIPWPWLVARASGLSAYVLSFIVIILGIGLYTRSITYAIRSSKAFFVHKQLSVFLLLFVLIHLASIKLDEYIGFGVIDFLVPFSSSFKPFFVGLGVISFYALLIVVLSSFFLKSKHRNFWKTLHYLAYPMFLFGLLHGVFTGTDTASVYVKYMYIISGAVFGAAVLYRIWFGYFMRGVEFVVKEISSKENNIIDIVLSPSGERNISKFKPGQHILLSYYDKEKRKMSEKRPFSVAGFHKEEGLVRLGIRRGGKFTTKLSQMEPGKKIKIYGPFGDFIFDEVKMHDVVFIAGGIGITPFFSAIKYATDKKLLNKITLLYSNRTASGVPFLNEIKEFEKLNKNFKAVFAVTNEEPPVGFEGGRIDRDFILRNIERPAIKHFLVCGPSKFNDSIVKALREAGVPYGNISAEYF